jgi:hypothetical protein
MPWLCEAWLRLDPRSVAIKREVLGDVPATSTAVEISGLAIPVLLVEVTVTAVRPDE